MSKKQPDWRELVEQLHAQQGGQCFYCGTQLTIPRLGDGPRPRTPPVLEHRQPRHRGGPRRGGNVVLSCPTCNSRKGRMNVEEFRLWCGLRMGHLPYRFALEPEPLVQRDYLVVVSPSQVAALVKHNASGALW